MNSAEGAQRRYRAPCPSCGAPVEFASAQSTHAVCPYCQSLVVREGALLKRVGQMAELAEDHSPLQLGAAGQIDGQGFTLVGRLQYRYGEGTWNEWYALLSDGASAWLSEDNGAYVFSRPVATQRLVPPAESFRVGASTVFVEQAYAVTANTTATLIAAEGELPRVPALGVPFAIVELRTQGGAAAEQRVFSVEYGSAPPTLSEGRAVQLADLNLRGLKNESVQATSGRQFACPNCGAPVLPRLDSTQSITCPQCQTLIDLSSGIGGELRHATQDEPVRPLIALGSVGHLQGVAWQVVGFQHRTGQTPGDDETFGWQEYLLYNLARGFSFLVDAEDGWSLVAPITGAPLVSRDGASATYDGVTHALQWSYTATTTYVLGEFYWQVQRGQVTHNRDYAQASRLLSEERSERETTWSAGSKLTAGAVAAAFKLEGEARLRRADAQPFSAAPSVNISTLLGVLILILIVLVLLSRCEGSGGGGSGVRSSGGSFGGYSSGGGHK